MSHFISELESDNDVSLEKFIATELRSVNLESEIHLDIDPKRRMEANIDKIAPWIKIPAILCVFWPADDEIHRLIWDYHENDRSLDPILMLTLLNFGSFVTSEANAYRISQLVAYRKEEGVAADIAIAFAAHGLALSHPEEAIPNLIQARLDHIDPRAHVLITLAGYKDMQLNPYRSRLYPLVTIPRSSLAYNDELQRALNRLVPYVTRQRRGMRAF